jgi:hypothetical protein
MMRHNMHVQPLLQHAGGMHAAPRWHKSMQQGHVEGTLVAAIIQQSGRGRGSA